MAAAGRVGDKAQSSAEGEGPGEQGASTVFVNGMQALRADDTGSQSGEGASTWQAKSGSAGVFFEGRPAHRVGDETAHGDAKGELAQGSPNVMIGDYGGPASPRPHDRTVTLEAKDALGRPIADAVAQVRCPHKSYEDRTFTGQTTLDGLCSAASVTVAKNLQTGTWDPGAASGQATPVSHTLVAQAGGDVHHVHAPAPGATPAGDHRAHIARPEAAAATVQLSTVHNWMELVYQAFGFTMPTGAGQLAMIGMREASLGGGDARLTGDEAVVHREERAGAGDVAHVEFTREDRNRNLATATTFNDLVFCAITAQGPRHEQQVDVYVCTIDAGFVESRFGMPILLEGKLYYGLPGQHHANRREPPNACLHLYTELAGGAERISIARLRQIDYDPAADRRGGAAADRRDPERVLRRARTENRRTFTSLVDAEVVRDRRADKWLFCTDEDSIGIHMHWGSERDNVGNWSSGCTVLRHAITSARYVHFKTTFQGATNRQRIPYLVVSSRYVKSYAEWVRGVDLHPERAPTAESVIRQDQLVTPTGVQRRYLPSILTKGFADEVQAQVVAFNNTETPHPDANDPRYAQNLTSSLERCLFELSFEPAVSAPAPAASPATP